MIYILPSSAGSYPELAAFIVGVKNGDFDHVLDQPPGDRTHRLRSRAAGADITTLGFSTLMLANVYVDGSTSTKAVSRARRTSGWVSERCARRCCHRTRFSASVTSRPRSALKRIRISRCARAPTSERSRRSPG